MTDLAVVLAFGLGMAALALVGAFGLALRPATLERLLLPLVAFAAGSLLGGAFLHLIPAALGTGRAPVHVFLWVLAGFCLFFVLEQALHWHHCHRAATDCADVARRPQAWLILIADGLHNLLGGLAVGSAFAIDFKTGLAAWLAAAAHEVPQELGDFGVLVHAGYAPRSALALNFASALTFPLGCLLAHALGQRFDVAFLLPLAAGNFLYIAASDLIPEVNRHHGWARNAVHLAALLAGIGVLFATHALLHHGHGA